MTLLSPNPTVGRHREATRSVHDANKVAVHDPDYRVALDDFTKFLEVLSEKVSEVDETIPELPVKDIVRFGPSRLQQNTSLILLRFIGYTEVRTTLLNTGNP